MEKNKEELNYSETILERDNKKSIQINGKENVNNNIEIVIAIDYSNLDEVVRIYDEILKKDPSNGNALNEKGRALCKLKKYDEAIKCYDSALDVIHKNEAEGKGG